MTQTPRPPRHTMWALLTVLNFMTLAPFAGIVGASFGTVIFFPLAIPFGLAGWGAGMFVTVLPWIREDHQYKQSLNRQV